MSAWQCTLPVMAAEDTKMRDLRDIARAMTEQRLTEAERSELTSYNFVESVRKVRVLRRLALAFANEREDEVPDAIAQQVRSVMRGVADQLNPMISFHVEQPNAERKHSEITREIDSAYNTMLTQLRIHIRGHVDSAAQATRLDEAAGRAEQLAADVQETLDRAEALVDRAQTLTAEIAASKLSSHYDQQADRHKAASRWFLIGAGVTAFGVAMLATVLFLTLDERPTAEWTSYLRDLGVRVFVLGLGLYVAAFLVKGYRANQHLLVINDQKANALKTFLLFQASASEDAGSRQLITAELVKAVFAANETGFLDNTPDRTVVDGQASLLAMLTQQRQQ